ncbi:MAG TPA: NAD(P)H-hydrate epimerase, partial [Acidobacteriota bacterium]|nr:NAD(P)H-hydrate epimerase [Acidobacteriota bacterium]
MKLLTASQMREVDRRTMTEIGIPGTTLMENAGIAVVQVLEEEFEKLDSFHIGVICGRGNNGGDGFVIARHLFLRGITPHVYVIGGADGITGDARVNLEIIRNYRDIPIA